MAAVSIRSRSRNNVYAAGRGALLPAGLGNPRRKNRSHRRAGTPRFRRGNTNSVDGASRRPAIRLLWSAPARRVWQAFLGGGGLGDCRAFPTRLSGDRKSTRLESNAPVISY